MFDKRSEPCALGSRWIPCGVRRGDQHRNHRSWKPMVQLDEQPIDTATHAAPRKLYADSYALSGAGCGSPHGEYPPSAAPLSQFISLSCSLCSVTVPLRGTESRMRQRESLNFLLKWQLRLSFEGYDVTFVRRPRALRHRQTMHSPLVGLPVKFLSSFGKRQQPKEVGRG